MADHDQPFLRRWSRRKRQGGVAPVVETGIADPPPVQATEPVPQETPPATTDDATADLPDVETLDKDSDYTGFLREGVPEQLRRRALHKLWRSDPAFAHLDGLNDYDEDFTLAFTDAVTKAVKTAYKVGKGFVEDDEKDAEVAATDGDRAGDAGSTDDTAARTDGVDEPDDEQPT